MQKMKKAQKRRSGMALIVVVGLIALLVISSVTFAIIMRVERASAANARNTLMARQVTKTALSQALLALDQNVGSEAYPQWYRKDQPFCPWWSVRTANANSDDRRNALFWRDTLGSIDHSITRSENRAPASVMNYAAEPYLSSGIRHRVNARKAEWYKDGPRNQPEEKGNIGPEWVAVTSDGSGNEVIGRYAFLILNTTGYLDLAALVKKTFPHFRGAKESLELAVTDDFFVGTKTAQDFKSANRSYTMLETVADVLFKNGYDVRSRESGTGDGADHGTIFKQNSAFSALSFMPLDVAAEKSDQENDRYVPASKVEEYRSKGPQYKEKVFLGKLYDDPEKEIQHLKKHKARIMKAFYDSGLKGKSTAYPQTRAQGERTRISDPQCNDCGLAAYTLPANCNSEQAYWAYLGLLDYLDAMSDGGEYRLDNALEGDDDEDKFGRPVTEPIPLFNGFMGTLEFTRQECVKKAMVNDGTFDSNGNPNQKEVDVYDLSKIESTIRFNGKVVFANRCIPGETPEGFTEGNMAVYMDMGDRDTGTATSGQFEEQYVAPQQPTEMQASNGNIESASGDGIFLKSEKAEFGLGADEMVRIMSFTTTKQLDVDFGDVAGGSDPHPCTLSDAEYTEKTFDIPERISIGGGGSVYWIEDEDELIHQTPAGGFTEDIETFLRSTVNTDAKGTKFVPATAVNAAKVFRSEADARAAFAANPGGATPENSDPQRVCNLRTWKADILLTGEMIDPRYQHIGVIADEIMAADPAVCVVSHLYADDEEGTLYGDLNYTYPQTFDSVMKAETTADVDKFAMFMNNFLANPEEFGDFLEGGKNYFDVENESGASLFQKELLASGSNVRNSFHGYFDGSYMQGTSGIGPEDTFEDIWFSMYVKNGHDGDEMTESGAYVGMESIGELGYLPIGPYATIRLFGFQDEEYDGEDSVARFNQLPEDTPYHTVLDHFSLRRATPADGSDLAQISPVRGLVNPNTVDIRTLSSVFNKMATITEYVDRPKNGGTEPLANATEPLSENDAKKVAEVLSDSIAETVGTAEFLSDLGVMFETDDLGDVVENETQRENLIRNSCGLMTMRGNTFTILVKGEAYSTLFGRSELKDGVGTTLASRSAIAQVWRDTIPDADGNYPIFIQFFKIFDE